MQWPKNKPMSPDTAQKLIDALIYVKNHQTTGAIRHATNLLVDIEALIDESQAHYPPLNTSTPKAPYDGTWKPEKRYLLNPATGEAVKCDHYEHTLPFADAKTVDKLVKRVEMLESAVYAQPIRSQAQQAGMDRAGECY